jgi:hypothetical protein
MRRLTWNRRRLGELSVCVAFPGGTFTKTAPVASPRWGCLLSNSTCCRLVLYLSNGLNIETKKGTTVMQALKPLLSLAAVILGGVVATTSVAEARHYRDVAVSSDYVMSGASCAPPQPHATYIDPGANWEPFFRRHIYRYGPILVCRSRQ